MKFNIFEGARRISLVFGFLWVVGCLSYAIFNQPYWQPSTQLTKKAEKPSPELMAKYQAWKAKKDNDPQKKHPAQPANNFDEAAYLAKSKVARANATPYQPISEDETPNYVKRIMAKYGRLKRADETPYQPISEEEFVRRAKELGFIKEDQSVLPVDQPSEQLLKEFDDWYAKQSDKPHKLDPDNQGLRDIGGGAIEGEANRNSNDNPNESKDDNAGYKAALLKQWKEALIFLFGGLAFGWVFVTSTGWIVRGFLGIPRGQDFRPNS